MYIPIPMKIMMVLTILEALYFQNGVYSFDQVIKDDLEGTLSICSNDPDKGSINATYLQIQTTPDTTAIAITNEFLVLLKHPSITSTNMKLESCLLRFYVYSNIGNETSNNFILVNQALKYDPNGTYSTINRYNESNGVLDQNYLNYSFEMNTTYPKQDDYFQMDISDICKNLLLRNQTYALYLSPLNKLNEYKQLGFNGVEYLESFSPYIEWNFIKHETVLCGDGIVNGDEQCDPGQKESFCCKECKIMTNCFCNTEPSQCSCSLGTQKSENNTCVCPSPNQFLNETQYKCFDCDESCNECSGPTSQHCLQCKDHRAQKHRCDHCEKAYKKDHVGLCTLCLDENADFKSNCTKCLSNITHDIDQKCNKCEYGYEAKNQTCSRICSFDKIYRQGICVCPDKTWNNTELDLCQQCSIFCTECFGKGPEKCVACNDPHAEQLNCSKCQNNYEMDPGFNLCKKIEKKSETFLYLISAVFAVAIGTVIWICYNHLKKKFQPKQFMNELDKTAKEQLNMDLFEGISAMENTNAKSNTHKEVEALYSINTPQQGLQDSVTSNQTDDIEDIEEHEYNANEQIQKKIMSQIQQAHQNRQKIEKNMRQNPNTSFDNIIDE